MGIPNLFEDNEKVVATQDWHSMLSASADIYRNCVVKTLTHVKNLHSKVVHEYLQAIVEDLDSGNRTRLIAERQTGQDQVILGRWASKKFSSFGSSSSSSGPSGDLPLPLFSITFNANNLRVLDLAGILAETTKIGGKYNLLTKNCYWFAVTAYEALKLKFSGLEEPWYFSKWRGRLILFKGAAEGKASEFQEERNQRMRWAPSNPVPVWNFLEEVYKSSIRLGADSSPEADDFIEENLTSLIMRDMDENKTIGAMEGAEVPASLSGDIGLDEAYLVMNKVAEAPEYIKVYKGYKQNEQVQEPQSPDDEGLLLPPNFQVIEPVKEEEEKLDFVVQALVGQLLSQYKEKSDQSV